MTTQRCCNAKPKIKRFASVAAIATRESVYPEAFKVQTCDCFLLYSHRKTPIILHLTNFLNECDSIVMVVCIAPCCMMWQLRSRSMSVSSSVSVFVESIQEHPSFCTFWDSFLQVVWSKPVPLAKTECSHSLSCVRSV
jgi:hypothetical protein